jgi:hypothetical protein
VLIRACFASNQKDNKVVAQIQEDQPLAPSTPTMFLPQESLINIRTTVPKMGCQEKAWADIRSLRLETLLTILFHLGQTTSFVLFSYP